MDNTVKIRLNRKEKEIFSNVSKLYNSSISSTIKKLAIGKIEDEMNYSTIKKYEKSKQDGKLKTKPINILWEELDINDK